MLGKKLKLKKDSDFVTEIIGIYPGGQVGRTETGYQVTIGDERFILTSTALDILFEEVKPKPIENPLAKPLIKSEAKEGVKDGKN